MLDGVGTAKLAANTLPVTWVDRENTFVESAVSENPVMKVAAAGLTPRLPVTAEVGTVEIALFARIAKLEAAPRFTGLPGASLPPVRKLQVRCAARLMPRKLVASEV